MVNIQVRVDEQLRDQAQQILSQMGMDMTTAVRLFLPNPWNTKPATWLNIQKLMLFNVFPCLGFGDGALQIPKICFIKKKDRS